MCIVFYLFFSVFAFYIAFANKLFSNLLQCINVDHGEVVVVLVDLGDGSVEHSDDHLTGLLLSIRVKWFTILWVLQLFSRELAVVPINDTHFSSVFGGQRPDWFSLQPPVLQTGLGVLLAEQFPGVEVEHVVSGHAGGLGVEAGGKAGPDGEVVWREHGDNLSHGGTVLFDPFECLQSVSSLLCHVPVTWSQVIPSQSVIINNENDMNLDTGYLYLPSDDDYQQRTSCPFLISFVFLVRGKISDTVTTTC